MIAATRISWKDLMMPAGVAGEILALQRGERDAFDSLLSRYRNRVYRYLLRWVREPVEAEDLFQQTWLRIIENIQRVDPGRSFDAWLFAVARNVALDHLRRRRPRSFDEPVEESLTLSDSLATEVPGALEEVLRSERAQIVLNALESQPPAYREILCLRFEEEMKLEEIAEVLAIPLGTVKSRLARAMERLRATLLRMGARRVMP